MTSDSTPIHLGVNLLWLVPGIVGGSEEYAVRTLLAFLDRKPQNIEVTVFALESFSAAHPEVAERVEVVSAALGGGHRRPVRLAAESTWLAREVRRRSIDLVHHVGGRMPAVRSGKTIVTVHDLQPLILPANFGAVKSSYLRFAIPRSVRAADMVIAPSEFVRDSLIAHFGLPADRVVTVSAGYETPRLPTVTDPSVSPLARSMFDSGRPFFVYPAVTHPHKNHATVLRAFAALRDSEYQPLLVLTGGAGSADAQVDELVRTLELGDSVLRLGRVPRRVLDLLIAKAEALVFPSEFEGFGIPILEAMALGCPVIAADATAVPEVVGSAGILVPPTDVEAWRITMAERLAGNPPRAEAAAAGRAQAARYAWATSGERLEGVYRAVGAGVAG